MNCSEFCDQVDESLDRGQAWSEVPALARHAAECPGCARWAGDVESVLGVVRRWARPVCPRVLVDRVWSAYRRQPVEVEPAIPSASSGAAGGWGASREAFWAAIAASLVIAALPLAGRYLGQPGAAAPATRELAARATRELAARAVAPAAADDVSEKVSAEVATAPAGDTAAAAGDWTELVLLLPTGTPSQSDETTHNWLEQLNQGLEPISASASGAWAGLFEALPDPTEASPL